MINGMGQLFNNIPNVEKAQHAEQQSHKLAYRYNIFQFQKQINEKKKKPVKSFPPFKVLISSHKKNQEDKKDKKSQKEDHLTHTIEEEKISSFHRKQKNPQLLDLRI